MNDNIKKSLKQRSKLTKIFYKNDQRKSDCEKVLEKFVKDICAKVNIFNNYFSSIYTPIKTSVLPPFSYKKKTRIYSFKVTESDLLSIIKSLGSIH